MWFLIRKRQEEIEEFNSSFLLDPYYNVKEETEDKLSLLETKVIKKPRKPRIVSQPKQKKVGIGSRWTPEEDMLLKNGVVIYYFTFH